MEFSPTNALSEKKIKREKHPPGKALKKNCNELALPQGASIFQIIPSE